MTITRKFAAPMDMQGYHGHYLLVTASTERGYFSFTADAYSSEQAFRMGNENAIGACGSLHREIAEVFPELAPYLPMHLSDAQTGEPMHALDNSWYYIQPIFGFKGWQPEGYELASYGDADLDDVRIAKAAKLLRMEPDDVRDAVRRIEDEARDGSEAADDDSFEADAWAAFVDERRRFWATEAAELNAFLRSLPDNSGPEPAQVASERYTAVLDGLEATAVLIGEMPSPIVKGQWCYRYGVTVKDDAGHVYRAPFWGSVADYERGFEDARGALFGTLHEMMSVYWDEDGEYEGVVAEIAENEGKSVSRAVRRFRKRSKLIESMCDALLRNEHIIGT